MSSASSTAANEEKCSMYNKHRLCLLYFVNLNDENNSVGL